jgi:carbonic anhydrase
VASLKAAQAHQGPICGDIATVPQYPPTAPINRWLLPLTKLAASLVPSSDPLVQLVEENIRAQVANISSTETGRKVWIHGWVFEIEKGRLRDLNVSRKPVA